MMCPLKVTRKPQDFLIVGLGSPICGEILDVFPAPFRGQYILDQTLMRFAQVYRPSFVFIRYRLNSIGVPSSLLSPISGFRRPPLGPSPSSAYNVNGVDGHVLQTTSLSERCLSEAMSVMQRRAAASALTILSFLFQVV